MSKEHTPTFIRCYCPTCGHGFEHKVSKAGKTFGGISGAGAGALLGAKIGIVAGPLGAMAGTIPGALFGAIFGGKSAGAAFDDPKCPKCGIKFSMPK